ncbi:MAG: hypothetical protein J6B94_12075 [Lachnospiraceae bacterium]|nr:hypothetical protein [Lachnospiraceae bacterium]
MSTIEQGCIDIWIDEIVPCLKDTETGDIKETVVFKIESRAYLKKFKKSNGWHINWNEIPKDVEVYALALKDDNTIQGLVGVRNDKDSHAAYLHWACTAPHNNKHEYGKQKYIGGAVIFLQLQRINLLNGDMKVQCMDLQQMKSC